MYLLSLIVGNRGRNVKYVYRKTSKKSTFDKYGKLDYDQDMDPQGNQSQALMQFVDKLIEEKGFLDLTPEVREELKKDLLLRIDSFIAARVIAALSDTDVLTFEQMLKDKKPQEEVQKFVESHVPDYMNFLTNVLLEFRGVYLGGIKAPQAQSQGDGTDVPPPPPPAPVEKTT